MHSMVRLMVVAALCCGSFLITGISYGVNRESVEGPGNVETGWPATVDPQVSGLLDDLHEAKKEGDMDAARAIEEDLARLRGKPLAFRSPDRGVEPELQIRYAADGDTLAGFRWEDNDVLIRGSSHGEVKPVIAGDSQGRLYAAWEHSDENRVMIYRSLNGGDYWMFWAWMYHPSIYHGNVTLAVGEGNEDWLLVAYEVGTTRIWLWRLPLDGPAGTPSTPLIYECPDGLSRPRIVTDCAEYPGWYAYVVFNAMTVEGWAVCFTRSIDSGQHWQEVPDIIGWHCDGWDATGSRPDIDFGSRCLYATYSTPVSPCSNENREIFVNRSTDFGATWAGEVRLTTNNDLDYEPTIGAIKNYLTHRTVLIAYTRFYQELDFDVWYNYTQDGGATWSVSRCLSCLEVDDEHAADLETSVSQGALHAAYWHDSMIDYASAVFTTPTSWTKQTHINDGLWASADYPRPGVAVNPTRVTEEEAGICWVDERNLAMQSYDVYYDGPGTVETGAPEVIALADQVLRCCGPNPFTDATRFCFDLPDASVAKLFVSDVTGRVVRTLAEGRYPAGRHMVTWSGMGGDGRKVPTGVYLIHLAAEGITVTRSVTVLQ